MMFSVIIINKHSRGKQMHFVLVLPPAPIFEDVEKPSHLPYNF